MQAGEFWKAVTVDASGFLDRLPDLLERERVRYCVVGGRGVNACVEPLVSLDLDLALAGGELEKILDRFGDEFVVERFPHSPNLASGKPGRLRAGFTQQLRGLSQSPATVEVRPHPVGSRAVLRACAATRCSRPCRPSR